MVSQFRENILAEKLLRALSEQERKTLARMALFELPVPMAVVTELAQGASVETAMSLGLLEKHGAHEEDLYRVTTVLEPLLRPALSEGEWIEARRRAARRFHQVWWEIPERTREDRGLEVVRVAVTAGEQELAVGPADWIAAHWINRSRYLEAVALCRLVLAAFDDYRILATFARAEGVLGDPASAKRHYERALLGCPPSEDRRKSATIHNLAGLEAQQGDIERALELWQQSLEIEERIGDVQGKAATLHEMARVIAQQGDLERALELWRQSLEIKERIGNVRGKAATLAEMARAASKSGDHARSDQLNAQAAKALGSVRAYLDLIIVLGNLGASAQQEREISAAEAGWLVLRVQAPVVASLRALRLLFDLVATGDPLEPLLGAAGVIIITTRGENHPQRKSLGEEAAKILSNAAVNAGIQNQEESRRWFAENRLADHAYVFTQLLGRLEQLVGDRWLFDRTPLE